MTKQKIQLEQELFVIDSASKVTRGTGSAGGEGSWDTEFGYADDD